MQLLRTRMARIDAEASWARIPGVWLVILSDREIEIHHEPSTNGYQNVTTVRPGERLSPLNFPDQEIPVEEILG